jgi:RNA polymerase sigma factor (sigma-70 family)
MTSQQSDEHLIDQFLTLERDQAESAFERLMNRYRRLVMGVCRQVLKHEQDAEDAFQASFLALARQAATIQNRRSLGSWLHEVAYRNALRLRAQSARRRRLPCWDGETSSPAEAESHAVRNETRLMLLAEVDRLPEEYRALVVQSYLEGKSYEEVARHLGFPVSTLKGRLFRARRLLRARLHRSCGWDTNRRARAWA